MEPELELTKVAGDCEENECPAGYLSNRDTVVFQGPAVIHATGLRLGTDEQAVELPADVVRETARALGWG